VALRGEELHCGGWQLVSEKRSIKERTIMSSLFPNYILPFNLSAGSCKRLHKIKPPPNGTKQDHKAAESGTSVFLI
jgi:hypothetical protein